MLFDILLKAMRCIMHNSLSSSNGIRGGFRSDTIGTGRNSDSLMNDPRKGRRIGRTYKEQYIVDFLVNDGIIKDASVSKVFPVTITGKNGRLRQVQRGMYKGKAVQRTGYVNGVQDKHGSTVGRWAYL